MKDFEAVLKKFKYLGRYGLSQQALSEICQRAISVKELEENKKVRSLFCDHVKTMVWAYDEVGFRKIPAYYPYLNKHLEIEFPWPEFKGMRELKGQETTGLPSFTINALRGVLKKKRK